jgi:hypothetical protein
MTSLGGHARRLAAVLAVVGMASGVSAEGVANLIITLDAPELASGDEGEFPVVTVRSPCIATGAVREPALLSTQLTAQTH